MYFDDHETRRRFSEVREGENQLFPLFRRYENHLTYELHLIDPLLKFTRVKVKIEGRKLRVFGKHAVKTYHDSRYAFDSERAAFVYFVDLPPSINLKYVNQHFVNGLMIIQFEKTKNLDYEK